MNPPVTTSTQAPPFSNSIGFDFRDKTNKANSTLRITMGSFCYITVRAMDHG